MMIFHFVGNGERPLSGCSVWFGVAPTSGPSARGTVNHVGWKTANWKPRTMPGSGPRSGTVACCQAGAACLCANTAAPKKADKEHPPVVAAEEPQARRVPRFLQPALA